MWETARIRRQAKSANWFRPGIESLEDRTAPSASGIGVFDPGTGDWSLRSNATAGTADAGAFHYNTGKIAIVGDWNGDGTDGVGVYISSTGTWRLRNELSAGAPDAGVFQFGPRNSIPVVGDWNGDHVTDIGVYVP